MWVVPSAAKAADDRRPCQRVRVSYNSQLVIAYMLEHAFALASIGNTCRSTGRYHAFHSISAASNLHNALERVGKVRVIELRLRLCRTMTWATHHYIICSQSQAPAAAAAVVIT